MAWDQKVEMKQIEIHNFCIELRVGDEEGETSFWIILVYASTNGRERQQQLDFLRARKQQWGPRWVLGGDLNDNKNRKEKKGRKIRQETSFQSFSTFLVTWKWGILYIEGKHSLGQTIEKGKVSFRKG